MLGKLGTVLFEPGDFFLNVILEQIAISLCVTSGQAAEFGLK